jgi:hypothetical protein
MKHDYDYACETYHVNDYKISGKLILKFKVLVCMNDIEKGARSELSC